MKSYATRLPFCESGPAMSGGMRLRKLCPSKSFMFLLLPK